MPFHLAHISRFFFPFLFHQDVSNRFNAECSKQAKAAASKQAKAAKAKSCNNYSKAGCGGLGKIKMLKEGLARPGRRMN